MKKLTISKGDKFNMLTVIEEAASIVGSNGIELRAFRCVCDCGKIVIVRLTSLRSGNTKSCGCHRIKNSRMLALAGTGTKRNQYTKRDIDYWKKWS